MFPANVIPAGASALAAEKLPPQCPAPDAYRAQVRANPFFQAELATTVVRDEYAKLGRPVPLAIEVLVDGYNRDNECDLKAMRDSTETTIPISQLCGPWRAASEASFGSGFCAGGGPARGFDLRLRYHGRTYERRLIEANEAGRDGVEPMRLPGDQSSLALVVDILHRAEFGAARIELTNTGRAAATDVRLHPPPGYAPVGSDAASFDLPSGRTAVRRLETERGIRPQMIDRTVGVQWATGRGFVPGGRNTVLAVCALVTVAILYALWRDWSAFRHPAAPRGRPSPERRDRPG